MSGNFVAVLVLLGVWLGRAVDLRAEAPRSGGRVVGDAEESQTNDSADRAHRRHRRETGTGRGTSTDALGSSLNSGEAKQPQERSDSDLMAEALGDSPNAARIARIVAQTTLESRKKQAEAAVQTSVWKDPFAEVSDPPVTVRSRKTRGGGRSFVTASASESFAPAVEPQLEELRLAKRETARARAEAAAARADAAVARADAAKVKADLAKREASAAHADALAAKSDALAARAGCVAAVAGPRRNPPVPRTAGWREATLADAPRPDRPHKTIEHLQAMNSAPRGSGGRIPKSTSFTNNRGSMPLSNPSRSAEASLGATLPADAPPSIASALQGSTAQPASPPPPAPAGNESWARGILVVPITPLKKTH